jgi:hypothetical protein
VGDGTGDPGFCRVILAMRRVVQIMYWTKKQGFTEVGDVVGAPGFCRVILAVKRVEQLKYFN